MKRIFGNWWVVTGLAVLLLLLLFCWGLPLVVGFMRPWWVRLIFALLILGGWGLLIFLRRRKAARADAELGEAIAVENAGDAEARLLGERMKEALGQLRSANQGKRDYLYSKPWYVIIGPPGSGKTTALINSGLRFPFAAQAMKGVGGTRNLDFWFADEAVLVDTAGRYTSQDSDAAADAKGWQSFLSLLKKHRPLQPVNGVIVAIGVDELIRGDRIAIDAHAAAVRRRLGELRRGLEIAVPVYLLLTKADLIAGFTDFFGDLDVEARRAVLGHSFAFAAGKPDSTRVVKAFDDVAQSIADRQAKRLSEEPDMHRRGLILGFPSQFAAMRARLMRFVDGAFVVGDEPAGLLRGLYFTSGVQQGAPLDRLLAGMADLYDQPAAAAEGGSGRAYFLNRLLGEVAFAEAGLVQLDPKARARQRTRMTGAIAGLVTVSLLLVALWGVSFFQNRDLQATLLTQATAVQQSVRDQGIDLVQVSRDDGDLETALPVLDSLRAFARGYAERKDGGPPLLMRAGLFQTSHSELAEEKYRDGLRRILLPRLLLRLEAALQENASSPLALYEPLRVYLMLGGQRPGGVVAADVRAWVAADWEETSFPGADRATLRRRLGLHLAALLEDANLEAAWTNRQAPLDGRMVTASRQIIQTMSVADRAYAILRQKALASGGKDWAAGDVLSSADTMAFANGEEVLATRIPFFFTRAGFDRAYQPGLASVQRDLESDLWVLGGDADTGGVRAQIANVRPGVAASYAREYIAFWEKLIASLKPAQYFQNPAALGAFTKTPSPLKLLLLETRKNTGFQGGSTAASGLIKERLTARFGTAAKLVPTDGVSSDAGAQIAMHFKGLHDYVGDGKAPAPVDAFLEAVKGAGTAMISARSASGTVAGSAVQAEVARSGAQVSLSSAGAPPMLQGFVTATASGGSAAQTEGAKGEVSQAYSNAVLPGCKAATEARYPFFAGVPADASVGDMLRVFGMNGTIDSFVRDRLTPLMDTSGPVWRWRTDDPVAGALDPMSADEMAKAALIRDLLTSGVTFKVSLQAVGPGVDAAEFANGAIAYRFDLKNNPQRAYQWLPAGGVPEAKVTLYKGDQVLDEFPAQGTWAVFRLLDSARRQNAGELAFLATFGQGDRTATFRIGLVGGSNPFSRGGLWTFRCPVQL